MDSPIGELLLTGDGHVAARAPHEGGPASGDASARTGSRRTTPSRRCARSSPTTSRAGARASTCRCELEGTPFQREVWQGAPRDRLRRDDQLRRARAPDRAPARGSRGRPGQRPQPDRRDRALPPGDRRRRDAHRLRRRPRSQAAAARPRGAAARARDVLSAAKLGDVIVAIAGAHGKVARRLARLLVARGDQVRGLIRNPDHADDLRADGSEPVLCDLETAGAGGGGARRSPEPTRRCSRRARARQRRRAQAHRRPRRRDQAARGRARGRGGALRDRELRGRREPSRQGTTCSASTSAPRPRPTAPWRRATGRGRSCGRDPSPTSPARGRVRIDAEPVRAEVSRDDVAAVLAAVVHEPAAARHDPLRERRRRSDRRGAGGRARPRLTRAAGSKNFASCEVLHGNRFTELCTGASFAGDGTLRARSTRSRVGGLDPRKSWRQVESSFPAPSIREKI